MRVAPALVVVALAAAAAGAAALFVGLDAVDDAALATRGLRAHLAQVHGLPPAQFTLGVLGADGGWDFRGVSTRASGAQDFYGVGHAACSPATAEPDCWRLGLLFVSGVARPLPAASEPPTPTPASTPNPAPASTPSLPSPSLAATHRVTAADAPLLAGPGLEHGEIGRADAGQALRRLSARDGAARYRLIDGPRDGFEAWLLDTDVAAAP